MPGTLLEGEPVPDDGSLPYGATCGFGDASLGVYVHIPFCRTRCGYCDFNTYTHSELGGGASQQEYPATLLREVELARRVLSDNSALPPRAAETRPRSALRGSAIPPVSTVFFGGGTPTLLPPG